MRSTCKHQEIAERESKVAAVVEEQAAARPHSVNFHRHAVDFVGEVVVPVTVTVTISADAVATTIYNTE
jgi:hypothetical protein